MLMGGVSTGIGSMPLPSDRRYKEVTSDLWVAAEFRAWMARRRISVRMLHRILAEANGKERTPALITMHQKWFVDGGPGPRDLEVIKSVATLLGCEVSDLCCPSPVRASGRPTREEVRDALHLLKAEFLKGMDE